MTRGLNALAAVLLLISLFTRNPLLFMLAALLGLVAGLSWLWDRYALAGVTFTRRLSATRLFVSEQTDLSIEVVNAKPLPLAWLKIEDEWPADVEPLRGKVLYSSRPGRRILPVLLSLRFYERVRKRYHLRALQRGAFEFGPARLSSGDMFGFRSQEREEVRSDWLVVYPRVVPVTALGLPAAHPFGDARTVRRISDDPLRVSGVRPYVPGDSPRLIHWKATARRGDLQTRIFDPGASRTAVIFLDLRTAQGFPGLIPEYLELGISAAASVARYLLDAREAVGLYCNGSRRNEGRLVRLPASRRAAQWTDILESLAWLAGLPLISIESVLRAELPALPPGADVIAISSQLSKSVSGGPGRAFGEAAGEDLLAALLDAQRAAHPVTLLAIAEEAPSDLPAGLHTRWIGGRAAWDGLNTFELDNGVSG